MKCCICSQTCVLLEHYPCAPHQLMGVYDSPHLELRDLEIYQCQACGHAQIPAHIQEAYYQEYIMGAYWGASFRRVRERQVE